jgi:hypothetical protein
VRVSPFLSKVATFARSPQGRRVFSEAQKLAKDPAKRKQLDDARRRLMNRGGGTPPAQP